MKIYVVTTNVSDDATYDYDAFRGAFSSREKAEEAMRLRGDEAWNEIQERELDSLEGFEPKPPAGAHRTYFADLKIIGDQLIGSGVSHSLDHPGGVRIFDQRGGHDDRVFAVSSVSVEHAVEMAREARIKWIKEHEGKLVYDPDWHLKDRFS